MPQLLQEDWSGGIYRGRKSPPNGVYEALNALVDDEGNLFRRNGSSFKSNTDVAQNLAGLFDGYLGPGLRTLAWTADANQVYYLDSDDATPGTISPGVRVDPFARGAVVAGTLFLPCSVHGDGVFSWAGARKALADPTFPAVNVTNGSAVMTASGTSWTTKYEPGTIVVFLVSLGSPDGDAWFTVASVDSNTQITLSAPWPYSTSSGVATPLLQNYGAATAPLLGGLPFIPQYLAAAGAIPRLWAAARNRAYYSEPGNPHTQLANNFIDLPAPSQIIGADSIQDIVILFATDGVWTIANTDLDPVDDAGNVQWQQRRASRDVILWGDPGIAAWAGNLVVPAVDDVFLFAPSGEARQISGNRYRSDGGIRPIYRSYVAAGYQPGTASVHRGHYFLPIVNGTTWVDTLVCRLDRGFAWTRWAGHAASTAFRQRIGSSTRSPKLLGIAAKRITDLTACLNISGAAQDADGSTPTFTVDSNDDDLGPGIRPNTAEKVRYVYETTGGTPTFSVLSAIGPEGSSYAAATLKRGGGASDGTDYSAWHVGRKAERIRFRFTTTSQVTSLILRRREVTIRQAGQT